MLDISQVQLIKLQKHQLNNQGCKCQMCQKLINQQAKKIVIQKVYDHQSEAYGQNTKQFYIKIINKMADWEQKARKLRFLLPQICVYENSQPVQLISKKNENMHIKIIRDRSKMHMFEITQFFLQGFVIHNPEPSKKANKKRATSFFIGNYTQRYKNQCILIAKYKNNFYNMLTLTQIQNLFRSRYKYMRDGLLYLQTLVCTKNFNQTRISLVLKDLLKTQKYERAKNQIKIFHGEIKSSDLQYVAQEDQIKYENQLKQKKMRDYLEYLSIKIILALSRIETTIISESVFKFVHTKNLCYLIDMRFNKIQSNQEFWATAALKAFQYKLNKRMSMMDVGSTSYLQNNRYLSTKAQNLSAFLQKSTSSQWDQMKMIKTRLQRLQKQKKSLMQSQSAAQTKAKNELSMNKSFKIRNMHKH